MDTTHHAPAPSDTARVARLTLVISLLVLGLKYLAYRLTGSISLYSDALESIVNVVAAGIALFAVRVAARPPDENHPYGHTKAEYLSAVLEGALILFAAVEIVQSAWERFLEPVPLQQLGLGVGIAAGATLLNGAWAAFLVRTGRRHRSPALVADGHHLWTDVVTTFGVLAGIGLATATGWWVVDPLMAIVVAANVVLVGLRLVRESVGGLMDESVPPDEMEEIQQAIHGNMKGALEAHDLRARHAGPRTFVEFHLILPGDVSVAKAHEICDRLEGAIQDVAPKSSITIHVEPEHKAKQQGRVVPVGMDASGPVD